MLWVVNVSDAHGKKFARYDLFSTPLRDKLKDLCTFSFCCCPLLQSCQLDMWNPWWSQISSDLYTPGCLAFLHDHSIHHLRDLSILFYLTTEIFQKTVTVRFWDLCDRCGMEENLAAVKTCLCPYWKCPNITFFTFLLLQEQNVLLKVGEWQIWGFIMYETDCHCLRFSYWDVLKCNDVSWFMSYGKFKTKIETPQSGCKLS